MPKYKTLAAVLEALSDGRVVKREDVPGRVLDAKIWVSGSGQPGCLYDYGPHYSRSVRAAVEDLLFVADDAETGIPRGMATALRRDGSYSHDGVQYEVSQDTLRSVL